MCVTSRECINFLVTCPKYWRCLSFSLKGADLGSYSLTKWSFLGTCCKYWLLFVLTLGLLCCAVRKCLVYLYSVCYSGTSIKRTSRERLSEKMCMINYFCYFPLALVDICPRPLVPFSQISLKNSEIKTTHGLSRTLYPTTFLETAVYNEVLHITNDIFFPSNSKIYGK